MFSHLHPQDIQMKPYMPHPHIVTIQPLPGPPRFPSRHLRRGARRLGAGALPHLRPAAPARSRRGRGGGRGPTVRNEKKQIEVEEDSQRWKRLQKLFGLVGGEADQRGGKEMKRRAGAKSQAAKVVGVGFGRAEDLQQKANRFGRGSSRNLCQVFRS